MPTSTENYHLPLHVEGYSGIVPRVRGYHRIEAWTKDRLVRIVNTAWDLGAHHLTSPFTSLLSPMSSIYTNDITLASAAHVNRGAKYSFIWFMAADAMMDSPASIPPGAKYAIAFTIVTEAPHSAMALAFMLLRFQEMFVREGNYQRFDMVNLCYMLTPDEVYGVMFLDDDFDSAYQFANARCDDLDDLHYARTGPSESIVSLWNATHTTFAGSGPNGVRSHVTRYWARTRRFLLPG